MNLLTQNKIIYSSSISSEDFLVSFPDYSLGPEGEWGGVGGGGGEWLGTVSATLNFAPIAARNSVTEPHIFET